jgi:hypothetical protein
MDCFLQEMFTAFMKNRFLIQCYKNFMPFKYDSYKILLSELGRIDHISEINEIAVRDFLKQLQSSDDKDEYLKSKCVEHNIWVSLGKLEHIQNIVSLNYISQVYYCIQSFFYDFQREYNEICETNWRFGQGKTKLFQVQEMFKEKFNKFDYLDDYLIATFSYYTEVRDKNSHSRTTNDRDLDKSLTVAKSYSKTLEDIYKIKNSPKPYDEVDFEDFFLFTQVAKDLSLKISSVCLPTTEGLINKLNLKRFKKLNGERMRKAIAEELKRFYSIEIFESIDVVEEVVQKI